MKNNMSKRSRLASDTKWMYEKYPTFTKDLLLALERCDRSYIEKYIQENKLSSVDDFITFRDTPNVRTTLLVEAVRVGGQEAMNVLITEKKADVNKPGHDMKNPLMLATDASNVFMVQRLIALGANVNYPSPSSYITPLVLAIYACHPISEQQPTWEALTVLRYLVAAGADPNGNSAGNTSAAGLCVETARRTPSCRISRATLTMAADRPSAATPSMNLCASSSASSLPLPPAGPGAHGRAQYCSVSTCVPPTTPTLTTYCVCVAAPRAGPQARRRRASVAPPCDSRMSVCFLTRATCQKV